MTRPIVTNEKTDLSFGRVPCFKCGIMHNIFNYLFAQSDGSTTLNKIKQNIHLLQENQMMQQEQIREQYKLLYLTRIETTKKENYLENEIRIYYS